MTKNIAPKNMANGMSERMYRAAVFITILFELKNFIFLSSSFVHMFEDMSNVSILWKK